MRHILIRFYGTILSFNIRKAALVNNRDFIQREDSLMTETAFTDFVEIESVKSSTLFYTVVI